MQKLLIASDIHGSAHWCARLLERFDAESQGFEPGEVRLLLLGDVLYHGPRNDLPERYAPKEVIAMLNPLRDRLFCVRGNCDGEVDQMVLDFPILADYAYLSFDGLRIFATHGHNFNMQKLPPLAKGDVLLHGHTHVPVAIEFGEGNVYVNPGSLSIPKENSPKSYILYEDRNFSFRTLEGEEYKSVTL